MALTSKELSSLLGYVRACQNLVIIYVKFILLFTFLTVRIVNVNDVI